MNWVGGARNRVRQNADRKFHQKLNSRPANRYHHAPSPMKVTYRSCQQGKSLSGLGNKMSQDLIGLYTLINIHDPENDKQGTQPAHVLQKYPKRVCLENNNHSDIELPMSPLTQPSLLELVDSTSDDQSFYHDQPKVSTMKRPNDHSDMAGCYFDETTFMETSDCSDLWLGDDATDPIQVSAMTDTLFPIANNSSKQHKTKNSLDVTTESIFKYGKPASRQLQSAFQNTMIKSILKDSTDHYDNSLHSNVPRPLQSHINHPIKPPPKVHVYDVSVLDTEKPFTLTNDLSREGSFNWDQSDWYDISRRREHVLARPADLHNHREEVSITENKKLDKRTIFDTSSFGKPLDLHALTNFHKSEITTITTTTTDHTHPTMDLHSNEIITRSNTTFQEEDPMMLNPYKAKKKNGRLKSKLSAVSEPLETPTFKRLGDCKPRIFNAINNVMSRNTNTFDQSTDISTTPSTDIATTPSTNPSFLGNGVQSKSRQLSAFERMMMSLENNEDSLSNTSKLDKPVEPNGLDKLIELDMEIIENNQQDIEWMEFINHKRNVGGDEICTSREHDKYGISLIAGHLFSEDISQCNSVPNREKVDPSTSPILPATSTESPVVTTTPTVQLWDTSVPSLSENESIKYDEDTIKVPNQTISLNMSNPEIILSPDEDIHTQQKISRTILRKDATISSNVCDKTANALEPFFKGTTNNTFPVASLISDAIIDNEDPIENTDHDQNHYSQSNIISPVNNDVNPTMVMNTIGVPTIKTPYKEVSLHTDIEVPTVKTPNKEVSYIGVQTVQIHNKEVSLRTDIGVQTVRIPYKEVSLQTNLTEDDRESLKMSVSTQTADDTKSHDTMSHVMSSASYNDQYFYRPDAIEWLSCDQNDMLKAFISNCNSIILALANSRDDDAIETLDCIQRKMEELRKFTDTMTNNLVYRSLMLKLK